MQKMVLAILFLFRLPNVKMAAPYGFAVSSIINYEDTNSVVTLFLFTFQKKWMGSYSPLKWLPNCLPTLPKTTQLFANISEDGPTFC